MNTTSDEQLAERAKRGDRAAFGMLVDRYSLRLLRYLIKTHQLRIVVAEDIAQDTWARAWRAIGQREPGPFRGWLFQIARNLAIDHKKSADARRMQLDGDDHIIPLQPAHGEMAENLELHETATRLANCLDRLPSEFRRVFEGHASGIRDIDLAAELNVSPGTIRSRRSKARTSLQECLEGR